MQKNTALIGCGYWGKNLLRNLEETGLLSCICEKDPKNLSSLVKKYPGIRITGDYGSVMADPGIEAVVIATPASTHYALAKTALESGKHVFIEKPFTTSYGEASELVELAEKKKLTLMVGMTFLYNMAVRKVRDIIDSGEIGRIRYVFLQRRNLGKVREDVNVWWNLAPHDISILLYWLDKKAVNITARGFDFIQPGIEDVIMADLEFEDNTAAFIHSSWIDPSKVRSAIVVGSKKMIIYDDMSSDMKVQVYDKGIDRKNIKTGLEGFDTFGEFQLRHRAGDIYIPKIDFVEPLKIECQHFADSIEKKTEPLSSGRRNLQLVKILEAGDRSIKNKGSLITI
ncbi:MAG: Gfo/Idh/MocA family oxidoreductase [Elusimicrobia bacterium]|nr:Gfo/Idh/MocA family oxidoreductase [Elusimicrobiota bacterium]